MKENLSNLVRWYKKNARPLPWRQNPAFYPVWISEVMLQQTQVATMLPFYERWMRQFPDVESLAASSEEDVLRWWSGLGYYRRARNLRLGAKQIVEQGSFPTTLEGWLEISGVGAYTAGAILSIAENQAAPILDGNVERILARVLRISRGKEATYKKKMWKASAQLLALALEAKQPPRLFNQALMELGALICTPIKEPDCHRCPLATSCESHQRGQVDRFPQKKKRKVIQEVAETSLLLLDSEEKFWVCQAQEGTWRAGLWDLPQVFPKGVPRKALRFRGSIETHHVVTHHRITRTTQIYRWSGKVKKINASSQNGKWIHGEELDQLPVGAALKKAFEKARLQGFEGAC